MNEKIRTARLSVYSNSFLVVSKLIIGFLSGSVSVISEAVHSGLDLFASFIAYYSVKNSSLPADDEHKFGHGKIESLSGFTEGILIIFAGLWIVFESIKKLIEPTDIDKIGLAIIVMFLSSLINFIIARKLFKVSIKNNSIALKADAIHLMIDVYTSLGVMFSLFIIWLMEFLFKGKHFHFLDPLCAIIISFIIIKTGYELIKESSVELIDTSLNAKEIETIKKLILSNDLILSFKNLKTRKSGNVRFIEFDVIFDEKLSLKDAHREADNISAKIREDLKDSQIIIHMEPCTKQCNDKECLDNCKLDIKK
jgi:cation diffusion facilitator family transporter